MVDEFFISGALSAFAFLGSIPSYIDYRRNLPRMNWWKNIEKGDFVCDCRFRHLRVMEIHPEYIDRHVPMWYVYTPDELPDFLDELLWKIQSKFPTKKEWVDSTLILSDGSKCSAKHCCDPIQYYRNGDREVYIENDDHSNCIGHGGRRT